MRKFKGVSVGLFITAIVLSNVMSAKVAFEYSNMLWGIKYAGYSAPANAALVFAIPYIVGILICAGLIVALEKKAATNRV